MANLLTCHEISKHFGMRELFEGLSIHFSDGQRIGFLGPNGAGKTTFLRILAGLEHCDGGRLNLRRGARVCFMPQEDVFPEGSTVGSVVADAIADLHIEPQAPAHPRVDRRRWCPLGVPAALQPRPEPD